MIKLLNADRAGDFLIDLHFSDGSKGLFNGASYLQDRAGSLLEPLRNPDYFGRFFVDAGALCWPNGLELSPRRLRELANVAAAA